MTSFGFFSDGNRASGMQDALNGKANICQGLEDLCQALKALRCGKEYETMKNVVDAIHRIKKGLCEVKKGLHGLGSRIDDRSLKEIRAGIQCVCKGLEALCSVLKDTCCGNFAEAEKCLVEAIELIKKGYCKIDKGLNDICLY
ncbi:MAG TPA: hypothetical protein PKA19_03010 [Bacillota bacterium]|nr:hypothetical protein [Bacillota bacterium]